MRKAETDQPADESREPFTIFAMTMQGRAGWHVEIGSGNLSDVMYELEEQGIQVDKILSIVRGWQPLDVSPEDERRIVRRMAISYNWVYDPQTRYWYGPPDNLLAPVGNPVCADVLEVTLGPPKGGWLPVSLSASGQSAGSHVDFNYQRLPRLLLWLEEIVAGQFPRYALSQGDVHLVLVTFPADGDRLRLSALLIHNDAQWCFDVQVEKRELVRAFYRALRALVEDTETYEREWVMQENTRPPADPLGHSNVRWIFTEHFSLEAERLMQRPLESAIVEEYLGSGE